MKNFTDNCPAAEQG
jgi:hypothetical protein